MTDRKYKLTISILASNRKDTLPKTLESIIPILDNVSSELIITDTGCDDELLDVIRKYTDKIVKFQWCNDFAKARNVGLKLAQGEWFMFLDDDEWFEDATEIVDFFNSGEEKEYNSFSYLVRNYTDYSGMNWQDTIADRGIRLTKDTEFVEPIHEHYNIKKHPTKFLNAYAHHYGYVYETREKQREHALRNLGLIERQIVQGKNDLRLYFHLLQEYNILEMNEEAYNKARFILENISEQVYATNRIVAAIKSNAIYSLFKLGWNDKLIQLAEKYIVEESMTKSALCAVYAFSTYAYYDKGMYKEAANASAEYFKLRKAIAKDELKKTYEALLAASLVFDGSVPDRVFNKGLYSAVITGNVANVIDILEGVVYVDKLSTPDDMGCLAELMRLLSVTDRKEELGRRIVKYTDILKNRV